MTKQALDPSTVPTVFIQDTAEALNALGGTLREAAAVAADTETVILLDDDGNPRKVDFDVDGPGPWRVLSIAARFDTAFGPQYSAWVLDMAHVDPAALAEVFTDVVPWGWNANFDRGVFLRGGLDVRHWRDAMLYDAVLKQGAYYAAGERPWYTALGDAVTRHLGWDTLEGKDDTRLSYDEHTPLTAEQIRYAAFDAIATLVVGEELERQAKEAGLHETAERSCKAQPFVQSMKIAGLPFDVTTYQAVIDNATAKANLAAERIAVLTTGQDVLQTLVQWAAATGAVSGLDAATLREAPEAQKQSTAVEVGLPLLHDPEIFARFLADLRKQAASIEEKIANGLGLGAPVDDLFSEGVRYELPFKLEDEASIRRWINKAAPQFVAEYVAAAGGTSRGLVKAHDMGDIYSRMKEAPADVAQQIAQVATHLEAHRRYVRILDQYADIDGAATLRPEWNVSSGEQVKDHLNRFAQDRVLAFTEQSTGTARLLGKADSVDNKALKLIGGPLCEALLEFREHDKMVTTYGDGLLKYVHPVTGRLHANYTQDLTGTARLASDKPNAQNLSPLAKPHMGMVRKEPDGSLVSRFNDGSLRVLVYADLSQAELRFLAHMAQDTAMLEAFASGEDLHERTASRMFSVDMKALKANSAKALSELTSVVAGVDGYAAQDPDMSAGALYKTLRSKAKAVSFGYAYGLKGTSLAQQLTVQGVPTTKDEADQLLAQFDKAYPQVAAWMAKRVQFINDLAGAIKDQKRPSGVDFEASWRLHTVYYRANQARKALTAELGRAPTHREIAEHLMPDDTLRERLSTGDEARDSGPQWDQRVEDTRTQQAELIAWALGHYGSTILAEDSTPWSFESRNPTNRRRLFQIGTADWTMSMVALVARSRRKYAQDLTKAWVEKHNAAQDAAAQAALEAGKRPKAVKHIKLTKTDPRTGREVPLTHKELEQALPTKELRIDFVTHVLEAYGKLANPAAARDYLFRHAMADCIKAAGNQYRNHPIQSGVADAVLEAFARIDHDLSTRFLTAHGIQSVHDSIAVECDLQDAKDVRKMLVTHMEQSLLEMCPTVPCVADGAVLLSLDEDSALSDEELDSYINRYALAA